MAFFGLKQGEDFENKAAHPHQDFQEYLPRKKDETKLVVSFQGYTVFSLFRLILKTWGT